MKLDPTTFLDESEQRVLTKTMDRWNAEADRGEIFAIAYGANLTERQREVIQKVITEAKRLDLPTPAEWASITACGFH